MGQVSHRLVQAMYHADITQEELAKRMYVSRKTVGLWIKERNLPRADSFIMLCKILNVDPEWLLTGEGESPEWIL